MKWFDNWIRKKYHALDSIGREPDVVSSCGQAIAVNRSPDMPGTNFTLYPAVGGHIVELRHYDNKTDRTHTKLHIVTSDNDLGEAIGKIITYEALSR